MTEGLFEVFWPMHLKDWLASDARAKMTPSQRWAYLELLGFCHLENGISSDRRVLAGKLGIAGTQYEADLDTVLQEFEVHPANPSRLMHPKTWQLIQAQRDRVVRAKAGARKRWNKGEE